MKIDLFNHFFPKRYFDQFIDTGGIRVKCVLQQTGLPQSP